MATRRTRKDQLDWILESLGKILQWHMRKPGRHYPRGTAEWLNTLRIHLVQAGILRGRVVTLESGDQIAVVSPCTLMPRTGMILLMALDDPDFPARIWNLAQQEARPLDLNLLVLAATHMELDRLASMASADYNQSAGPTPNTGLPRPQSQPSHPAIAQLDNEGGPQPD